MSAPSAAVDVAGLLPWAWAVELLSDYPSAAPLPLLYEWLKKIPDNSEVEAFDNARERFALRCLQDALDSGFDGGADASGEARVHFDFHSSAQDALRKLARIKSEGKSTRAWKKDLMKFIHQKRANLPTPFLRQTTRIAHLMSSARFQSSENKCNNVELEEAGSSYRNCMPEKAVYEDKIISNPRLKFSHAPENMDENVTSWKDVQCDGRKFVSEITSGNLDACSLEETPVAQPPDIGRILPTWPQVNDQIGRTCEIPEQENNIGDREIAYEPSSSNKDGAGDLRKNSAHKVISERLSVSENLASGEDVQCNTNHFGKEIDQIGINSCTIERTSVKQPSGMADVLAPSADKDDKDDYVVDTGQNLEVENDMGQKEVLPQATSDTSRNNDEVGDVKSSAAQKLIVEKLKSLLDSEGKQIASSDTTEYSLCIKCAVGGEILTCSNKGCSIGVHARCRGYLKDLNNSGEFYCSFCSYSRAHAAYVKAKKKASIAKKELSAFLNGVNIKEGNFKDVLINLIKSSLLESNNHEKETKVDQRFEQPSKQLGGSLDCHERSEVVRASEAEALSPIDVDKHNVQVNDASGTGEMNDDNQHLKASAAAVMPLDGEVMISSPFSNRAERLGAGDKVFNTNDMQHGKDAEIITNDITNDDVDINLETKERSQKRKRYDIQPSIQGKLAKLVIQQEGPNRRSPRNLKSTKSYVNSSIHVGRRVQLRWTVEEEEALKDLVAKYSSNGGRTIPWSEILEQGNTVFQRTRKPMDLKDKWKNILKLKDKEDIVSGKQHGRKTS